MVVSCSAVSIALPSTGSQYSVVQCFSLEHHSHCYYAPILIGVGIKRWCSMTSDVCLSVCRSRTWGLSREQRGLARKTKFGTEVAHVTRDSNITFKIKIIKVTITRPLCSPPCCNGASGGCRGGHRNVLAAGNCCYVAVFSAAQGTSAPIGVRERREHIVAAARLQFVQHGKWHGSL